MATAFGGIIALCAAGSLRHDTQPISTAIQPRRFKCIRVDEMLKCTPLLTFAVLWISNAAFAQTNSNCFNATMPPMDIISACNQVIDADARHAQAHLSRGAAWYKLRDYDRAISDFSLAIGIDPKYVRAFYGRGLAFEKKGKLEDALADFIYFAQLDPSYPDAQNAIARVTLALKKGTPTAIKTAKDEGRQEADKQYKQKSQSASADAAFSANKSPTNFVAPKIDIARGRRLALVIGNDSYQRVPRLEKAVGDADAIAQALKAIGFTVSEGKNLDFERTATLIAEFEQTISKSDTVFL
jgi:tetratricopeptide (TPR) repeat protein